MILRDGEYQIDCNLMLMVAFDFNISYSRVFPFGGFDFGLSSPLRQGMYMFFVFYFFLCASLFELFKRIGCS